MSGKQARARVAAGPLGSDDFKLISGIGPSVESKLHGAGVLTYTQLAEMAAEDLAALVNNFAGMSAERITRQDWVGQARDLAAVGLPQSPAPESRQHYATFTVELLLADENTVRRTRVAHVQAGEEEAWAGWDESRLLGFMAQRASVRAQSHIAEIALGEQENASQAGEEATSDAAAPADAEQPSREGQVVELAQDLANATADGASISVSELVEVGTLPEATDHVAFDAKLDSALQLQAIAVVPAHGGNAMIRSGQPFEICLRLDFANPSATGIAFEYMATAYVKSLGRGERQTIGEASGTIDLAEQTTLSVQGMGLAPGLYRVEAAVALYRPSSMPARSPAAVAYMEGGLLRTC